VLAELNAISKAIQFAEETGCALHIVHVSSGSGVSLVAEARARGVDVSCETCPHYLVLTEEDVERLGAVAKCAPPLRSQHEQAYLWRQLFAGNIQLIGSDHSPAPASMKTASNFFQVWGGISGCQSLLPLLLTEGHAARQLSLSALTELTAAAVAQRFHLPQKGRISIGADADLALVDLQVRVELRKEDLHYRHQQSPYLYTNTGKMMQGKIQQTLVRGVTVYRDGVFNPAARGQFLRPAENFI
jgi:allantoinase